MDWITAATTIAKLVGNVVSMAQTNSDTSKSNAQAVTDAANETLQLVAKAHAARIAASTGDNAVNGLRSDDGAERAD